MGIAVKQSHTDYKANLATQPTEAGKLDNQEDMSTIWLPSSSLYKLNPNSANNVLVETDPAFANRKKWLSGEYMFSQLRTAPENVHKRLGDGYYEQRLVREQINQLTGKMFTDNQQDIESQYKTLMDNGISFASTFHLRPGIKLSAAQVASLTADIVWFETETVKLPDGREQQVLVPKVYLVAQSGDVDKRGALLSAQRIGVSANQIINQGVIAGREISLLQQDKLQSLLNQGNILGERIKLQAKGDITNLGGKMIAEQEMNIESAGKITHQSTLAENQASGKGYQRESNLLSRKALLYVKGEGNGLTLAAHDIEIKGADIVNEGKGHTQLQAENSLKLTALETSFNEKMGGGDHYRQSKSQDVIISHIKGKGDVMIKGKDILSEGGQLESEKKLTALAENSLVLKGAQTAHHFEEYHHSKTGSLAKKSKTSFESRDSRSQVGSMLSGEEIALFSENQLTAQGANIVANKDITMSAKGDVEISAATNQQKSFAYEKTTKSGIFSGGGLGITFGKQSSKHQHESEGWTQSDARSAIGSLDGNVRIQAGNQVNITGSDLIAEQDKRIEIEGKHILVEAGKDVFKSSEKHEFKQSGLTLAVSSPAIDMAMKVQASLKRSGEVKNDKLSALYKIKAAQELLLAGQEAKDLAGTLGALANGDMKKGDISNPSVKISVSVGSSQSKQESHTNQVVHHGSELSAGNLSLKTTASDIDVIGSKLSATTLNLDSAKDIHLKSAQDSFSHRSQNNNSGWSAGVFVGVSGNSYGVGLEASGYKGKGKENSDSITQVNSLVQGKDVNISSQHDTALQGAKVNADRLTMNVGNNLTIESRQDSNQYGSKQTQASAGASVTLNGSGSASINASRNKAKLNYAQVEEQSGLSAGEGGLAINVGNHTHLKGGLIESKAEESKNHLHTKTFSTEDIKNHSEVKVESHSVGLSTNMAQNAMSAVATTIGALGNKNESKQSLTRSAVGNNIHFTAESQDEKTQQNLTALSRDTENANQKVQAYDLAEIRENQELANVAGQVGARLVGDVAQMLEWEEGSPQKIALHAVVGALAAKWSGGNVAVGAGAGALSEWANSQIEDYLKNHPELNLSQDERYAIQQATAAALGAAVGAVIGGNSESVGQGALTAYNAEKFNRQLHPDELERIKALAKGDKDKQARLEAAACALVHCSAQIPEDSEDYAKAYQQAKALEELGSRPEFAEERALLKTQLADADPLDSLSGYRRPLFQYNGIQAVHDKVGKYDTKYGVTTRLGGALQTAGGAAVIGGSSAIAGAGCVASAGTGCALSITAGSVVATYGADQAYAGLNKIVTGKNQNTFGASLLANTTGLSQETVELIYGLPASFSGGKVLSSGMNTAGKWAVNEGKQTAGAVAYMAKEIGKDIKAGANALNNVAQRGYIQGTQLLEQGAKKAISSVQNYPNYVSKSMADTTVKVAVSNGIAAAGVKAGFEGYDYYRDPNKVLNNRNILNSVINIGIEGVEATVTSGMPLGVATLTGITLNKLKEGKNKASETYIKNVTGSWLDYKLNRIGVNQNYTPIIREAFVQGVENMVVEKDE